MTADELNFARDGARRFAGVVGANAIAALSADLEPLLPGRPGRRLGQGVASDVVSGPLHEIAARVLGVGPRPVRAVAFDKTVGENWLVAWHQDRTIAVRQRIELEGFGPWSVKDGVQHVAPPIGVLEGMATLRLHLDPVDDDNAPLKIGLGTHRAGFVPAAQAAEVAEAAGVFVCHARPGDVWAYSTPILHASEPSRSLARRRVLQVDYATADLPDGLEWVAL